MKISIVIIGILIFITGYCQNEESKNCFFQVRFKDSKNSVVILNDSNYSCILCLELYVDSTECGQNYKKCDSLVKTFHVLKGYVQTIGSEFPFSFDSNGCIPIEVNNYTYELWKKTKRNNFNVSEVIIIDSLGKEITRKDLLIRYIN